MSNQNILAIDTCTEVCSVSLYTKGEKISRFIQGMEKSSGLILPMCDEVFAEAELLPSDLDAIIYTKGPGSFTGVRVCVGVVQGISLAYDIPTMGFSTLEVVGFGASKKYNTNKVAVALDARMNEVYWGVYKDNKLDTEVLKKPNEVDALNQQFIGVGTGWGAYKDELIKQTGIAESVADFYPKSENLIDLYLTYVNQNDAFDDKLPLPTYLRNNIAQKSLK